MFIFLYITLDFSARVLFVNVKMIAYIAGLVIAIVAVLYYTGIGGFGRQATPQPPIHTGTGQPAAASAGNAINASKNTSYTSNTELPSNLLTGTNVGEECISAKLIRYIPNGNFSTGTYEYWNTTGTGWGDAPTNITYANETGAYYSHPWSGYNGTYFASTYHGGTLVAPGNLTSSVFRVTEPYLNFKLISTQSNLLYVQLLKNGTPVATFHYNTYAAYNNTNPQSTFVNASIILLPYVCQNVSVRLVVGTLNTGVLYNYISAGNFYMSKTQELTPGILVNQSYSRGA